GLVAPLYLPWGYGVKMFYIRYLLFIVCSSFICFGNATDNSEEFKLMHIGNSFSNNSTEYLSQLAEAGGKKITIYAATKGGCSLQCHADFLQLAQQNKPEGITYNVTPALKNHYGAMRSISLIDALKAEQWDFITIQQASRQSINIDSFEPYGGKLIEQIKSNAPSASIMVHKTWAYHDEHRMLKEQGEGPANHLAMHQELSEAYQQFAAKYELPLIPSADAMSLAYQQLSRTDTGPRMQYIRFSSNSLYDNDGAHLGVAGKYLTASVWYEVLFNESVVHVDFVPEELDVDFARQLRELAHKVVQQRKGL
ncbi:DUF4886 domain-containing protein, partial [Alkalimonas mucilaginosa]